MREAHGGESERDFAIAARICLLGVRAAPGRGVGAILDAVTKQPLTPEVERLRALIKSPRKPTKDFFKEILILLVDRKYLK